MLLKKSFWSSINFHGVKCHCLAFLHQKAFKDIALCNFRPVNEHLPFLIKNSMTAAYQE